MTETALVTKKVERHITPGIRIEHMPKTQARLRAATAMRELAQVEFGLTMDARTLHDRIRHTLPRSWRPRTTEWFCVEGEAVIMWAMSAAMWSRVQNGSSIITEYPREIPDAALVSYDTARRTGHFDHFWVIEATYWHARPVGADPWLVGQIEDRYIVLAYWD